MPRVYACAGAADQGEGGHGGAEDGHQQQERPAGAAGQEVVDGRVPRVADVAQPSHPQQHKQVAADHEEGESRCAVGPNESARMEWRMHSQWTRWMAPLVHCIAGCSLDFSS